MAWKISKVVITAETDFSITELYDDISDERISLSIVDIPNDCSLAEKKKMRMNDSVIDVGQMRKIVYVQRGDFCDINFLNHILE